MADRERVDSGSDESGYIEPPLSRCEQLLQEHRDIQVVRGEYNGKVYITQRIGKKWRNIFVDVKHEKGSERHYPTVVISAYESPRSKYGVDKTWPERTLINGDLFQRDIREYGLTTFVKVHVEDDEQVTPEVGYKERQPYPREFIRREIRFVERYSKPIPAHEFVATARIGLDILRAYREASLEQQFRIYGKYFDNARWDNIRGNPQFSDGEPIYDTNAYIAEVSPLLALAISQNPRLSIKNPRTKAIYALNALNKVTDAILPSEMPPPPDNRRERAPRPQTASRRGRPGR